MCPGLTHERSPRPPPPLCHAAVACWAIFFCVFSVALPMALAGVDGAYIGTTFPHLFFMTYGTLVPDPPQNVFVPRVFGFRVHSSAASGAPARGQGQHQQQLQLQHQQRQQERRRMLQPHVHLPLPPGAGDAVDEEAEQQQHQHQQQQQQPPVSAAPATGKPTSKAPSSTVLPGAGVVPVSDGGGGKSSTRGGRGDPECEGKSRVIVHIKEEERSWTGGRGASVHGKGAVEEAASDRINLNGKRIPSDAGAKGAGFCSRSSRAGNGHQPR